MSLFRFERQSAPFTHEQSQLRLKALGFSPRVIYDVGAFHGGWTKSARKVFPGAEYFLFEANADNSPKLAGIGERFFNVVLSSEDGAAREFHVPKNAVATGASLYRENTVHYEGENLRVVPVKTRRLDVFAAEHKLPKPDLVKLDVQGAELDILTGAGDLLAATSVIVAELSLLSYNRSALLIADVIAGIDKLGFKSVDICEIHRAANGSALQMDILFANPALFDRFRNAAGLI